MVTIIRDGLNYATIDEAGRIARLDGHAGPSDSWRVAGAVTLNAFGHATRRYTLAEVLANPEAIPWQYKNGVQRTFLLDFDHETLREWRNPRHSVCNLD